MNNIDARGKQCPQPVMMTKKAIEEGISEIKVIVDNPVAGQNVSRLLKSKGFDVILEAENDIDIVVTGVLEKALLEGKPQPTILPTSSPQGKCNIAILISRDILGGDDRDLGEVLIKGFLGTVYQLDPQILPQTVAFMNEGVKLALKDSSTCESLVELEKKGCKILICGTCTNHFEITDQIGVGEISNMFDIAEALLKADKVLSM